MLQKLLSQEQRKLNIFKNKYILLGEIPIITEKGIFIINGNTRAIDNLIGRIIAKNVFKGKNQKLIASYGQDICNVRFE